MSGFNDLCECICSVIRRNMQAAESILSSVNQHSIITANGGTVDGLQRPSNNILDSNTIITLFLCFIMAILVYSIGQRNRNLQEEPAAKNNLPPNNGRHFDRDFDGIR